MNAANRRLSHQQDSGHDMYTNPVHSTQKMYVISKLDSSIVCRQQRLGVPCDAYEYILILNCCFVLKRSQLV